MGVVKRIGKDIVSVVKFQIVPFVGSLTVARNRYVNVIYYHDIVCGEGDTFMRTNINVFKQQMEWLVKDGYETLRFDDLDENRIKFKEKRVLIAFDDGWRSNYTEIFEYMRQKGLKYNVFLTVGEISANPDYLTWDMVREMHESGLCGFGAHTFTHPSMADLVKIDYKHEVDDANFVFAKEMGYSPEDFCYPFGYYSEDSNLQLEKDSPYKRIYTSKKMYSYEQNGRIVFGRNGISTDDTESIFRKKVKGYMNYFKVYEDKFYNPLLSIYHKIRK